MNEIYVQTASFQQELRLDFNGSLKRIAEGGYSGIELFDGIYGGYSAKELSKYLAAIQLKAISAHVDLPKTEVQLEYLSDLECSFIVCPGAKLNTKEEAFKFSEVLNSNGRKAAHYGLKYGYHNHHNDFDVYDGKSVIEILIENTDPNLVTFELDTAWAWRAGVDAAAFINKYAGRFDLIHIKETSRAFTEEDDLSRIFARYQIKKDSEGRLIIPEEVKEHLSRIQQTNCKLGDGLINVPAVKVAAESQGVKAYIVEREYNYTGDIFDSLIEDLNFLKQR